MSSRLRITTMNNFGDFQREMSNIPATIVIKDLVGLENLQLSGVR